MVSTDRVREILKLAHERGVAYTAYTYGVKQSTVERYIREAKGESRPVPKTVQRGILFTDVHLDHTVEEYGAYTLVKEFAKQWAPDWVVNLGDHFDFDYLSKFSEDDSLLREGKRLRADVELGRRDRDYWLSITDDYSVLQGNHDERLDRLIAKHPMFEYLLSADNLFQYQESGVTYAPVREQPLKRGKLNMIHGWFANKYHTAKHLDRMSGNIVYGHVHEFQTTSKTLAAMGEEIAAWSLGCLCDRSPGYLKGRPSEWQNGFAVVYMDDLGNFNLYPIRIIGNSFIWGGERYSLNELRRAA